MIRKWELQLIYNKTDFKTKAIKKDNKGHYIIIKSLMREEYSTFVDIYAFNIGAAIYIKQILIDTKGEIDGNTIIIGECNTPLKSVDRYSRQKINKTT